MCPPSPSSKYLLGTAVGTCIYIYIATTQKRKRQRAKFTKATLELGIQDILNEVDGPTASPEWYEDVNDHPANTDGLPSFCKEGLHVFVDDQFIMQNSQSVLALKSLFGCVPRMKNCLPSASNGCPMETCK